MKKHVWIINHYASHMFFYKGGRHYYFAKYLREAGYEPVVFCANSMHGSAERFYDFSDCWQVHTAEEIGVPFIFVSARIYTGNGKQRVLNMIDFYRNVQKAAKEYGKKYGKPDIIYASSVHPLTLVAGIQLAKHFGVECVCEVRDLWPETLTVMSPKRFPRDGLLMKLLYLGERWIYHKCTRLIFTMEGGYDYIVNRGWENAVPRSKVFYINNGIDLESYNANAELFQLEDPDLDDPDTFKAIYTGSIRIANGIVQMMDCAELLQEKPDIRFLVYGGGEDLLELQKLVQERGLKNFILKGSVEKSQVPYLLTRSDVTLLNYAGETEPLNQYGSSNNKLFEYFAAGKPVVSNTKIAYSPIDLECCGIFAETSSAEDYAKAILQIYQLPGEEYNAMCQRAKRVAEDYDFKKLTQKLILVLETDV